MAGFASYLCGIVEIRDIGLGDVSEELDRAISSILSVGWLELRVMSNAPYLLYPNNVFQMLFCSNC